MPSRCSSSSSPYSLFSRSFYRPFCIVYTVMCVCDTIISDVCRRSISPRWWRRYDVDNNAYFMSRPKNLLHTDRPPQVSRIIHLLPGFLFATACSNRLWGKGVMLRQGKRPSWNLRQPMLVYSKLMSVPENWVMGIASIHVDWKKGFRVLDMFSL